MGTAPTAIKNLRLWFGLWALVALTGCNHGTPTPSVELYNDEHLEAATLIAAREADIAGSQDKLFDLFKKSVMQRTADDFVGSEKTLDRIDGMIADFEQHAKERPTPLPSSLLEAADYRGHVSDRVMLETYKALDALALDDLSGAREALTRAHQRQQSADTEYRAALAAAQQWAQPGSSQFDEISAWKDQQFQKCFNSKYAPLYRQELIGYAPNANPFSEYLLGIYLMTFSADAADREQAASILRGVTNMVADNRYIAEDAELAQQVASGGSVPPTTYVILESGSAPTRDETRISYPLILRNNSDPVKNETAVFPVLVTHPCECDHLVVVTSAGLNYRTAVVCDMDKIVAAEFREELPMVVTATLISSATKAIDLQRIDQAMNDAKLNDPLIRSWMQLIRGFVIKDFTHADTHTWITLPKMFSVAEFPTPADRNITLTFTDGRKNMPIELQDGKFNFVYVKTVDTWLDPPVQQFNLN